MRALLEETTVQNEVRASPRHPSRREDIELRAYFRYVDRGFLDGFDFEDWLAAERELLEEAQVTSTGI